MRISFEIGFTVVCVGSGILFVLILVLPAIRAAAKGDKWRRE